MSLANTFKYCIFLVVFTCYSFTGLGQFAKGQKFIGGSFSAGRHSSSSSSNGANDNSSSNFGFNPSLGFFLNEKIAVGGMIGYSFSRQKTINDGNLTYKYTTNSFSLGAFVNRYFAISEKFYFKLSGDFRYGRGTTKYESNFSNSSKMKSHGFGININPSFIFFPSPAWGIEGGLGGLGYGHSRGLSDDSKSNDFNIDYGTFSLGFAYYFNRLSD